MKKVSQLKTFGETLAELGSQNKDIYVLDGDLGNSTEVDMFGEKFSDRFINMGAAEQNMMGTAAGLALAGKTPFASTFAIFASLRAGEQIRTSIAYTNLNVKIVTSHSGLSAGQAGATHFSEQDMAVMRSFPNMTVIAPSEAVLTKKSIKAAAEHKGPVYIRLAKGNFPIVYEEDVNFEIGKSITLHDGDDLTIISTGVLLHRAVEIRKKLLSSGINVRIIDMHTVKPIDSNAVIKAASETGLIITLEDHNVIGGIGSAVSEIVAENGIGKVVRFGIPDIFCGIASPEELWDDCGMSIENVVSSIINLFQENEKSKGEQ